MRYFQPRVAVSVIFTALAILIVRWMSAFTPVDVTLVLIALGASGWIVFSQAKDHAPRRRERKNTKPTRSSRPAINRADANDVYLDALHVPCLVISPDNKIVRANPLALGLFSLPEPLPVSLAYLRNPLLQDAIEQAQSGKVLPRIVFEIPNTYGRIWRASLSQCADGCALVILDDYTEVVTAQKTRSDFLANASHELRTPLTALIGFIDTLRATPDAPKADQDKYLTIMQRQASRMRSLIEDLLSLSQIETTEFQRPESKADLVQTIEKAIAQFHPDGQPTPSVHFHSSPASAYVYGDEDELSQIIENLISNARKYAPESDIHITMGIVPSELNAKQDSMHMWPTASRSGLFQTSAISGPHVWVRVEDQGDGIPANHLPRLGERFYRVDASRSSRTPGTGLGLAIVKHIISRHRGGLGVESETGRGTAFCFWLPCLQTQAQSQLPFEA